MKVWWCEEHRAAESAEEGICEVGARILLVPGPYPKANYPAPCSHFVEMQLVPADARVVVLRAAESVRWCAEHRSSADPSDDDPSICLLVGYVDPHWQTPCRWVVAFVSSSTKTEPPKDPWDYDP